MAMTGPTPPGHGAAVVFSAASPYPEFAVTDLARGSYTAPTPAKLFEPYILDDVHVRKSLADPLRHVPAWDSCRLRLANVGDFIGVADGGVVTVYKETRGDYTPATDVVQQYRFLRRGWTRSDDSHDIELVDVRRYYLEGVKLPVRSIDEETYPDAASAHIGRAIPVCFGDFTGGTRHVVASCYAAGGWVDGATGTTDPEYIYQDTHDIDGNAQNGFAAGFLVYYFDRQEYDTPLAAIQAGGVTDITAAVATHTEDEGTFVLDTAHGSMPATWDANRYEVLTRFVACVTNDATVTGAITLRGNRPLTIAVRMLVEHAGVPASLLDLSVVDDIDVAAPTVFRAITSDIDVAEALSQLYDECGIEERTTPAGLITWRLRQEDGTPAMTFDAYDVWQSPVVTRTPWSEATALVPVREVAYPVDPEKVFRLRERVDATLSSPRKKSEELRIYWLREADDMREYTDRVLAYSGDRALSVTVGLSKETDRSGLMEIQPGDTVEFSYSSSLVDPDVSTLFEDGTRWRVGAVDLNVSQWLAVLTLWKVEESMPLGHIYYAGSGATQAVTGPEEQVTAFNTNGLAVNTTPNGDQITALQGGSYRIEAHASFSSSGAAVWTFKAAVNGTATNAVKMVCEHTGSGETRSCSAVGWVELEANDVVTLRCSHDNGASRTATFRALGLSIGR